MLTANNKVVFLLDVDNTLLDNDRFGADLGQCLERSFGVAAQRRYGAILAELRGELGYVDYLGALQVLRSGLDDDPRLLWMSQFLLEYPFAERLYPLAFETIAHLRTLGTPVILSDGDIVFQPRKIQRSGLWDAVDGRVLVYVHKELMHAAIRQHYPAKHYVMVDDKPQLLLAMKRSLGPGLTTVLVRQGHYSAAPAELVGSGIEARPDICVGHIGDLRQSALADFFPETAPLAESSTRVPEST
jgi:FMN phosphatase YigB (HAD superfamily)